MNLLKTIFRAITITTLLLFAAVFSITAAWLVANRFFDEPPRADLKLFLPLPNDQIPDNQNIAVGLLGLTAPSGSDVFEYGAKIKSLYASGAPWKQIQDMIYAPGTLQPNVESEQINCWLDPDENPSGGCLSFDQAPVVLHQNEKLLKRFKSLYHFKQYGNTEPIFNKAYFTVLKLSVAEMQLDLRHHKYEDAYQKWRNQFIFVKGNLGGTDNWIGKATELVAFGLTLPFLNDLLLASPRIANQHSEELLVLLKPSGIEAFNLDGVVRTEYMSFYKSFQSLPNDPNNKQKEGLYSLAHSLGQRNRILNRNVAFAADYAAALRLPLQQIDKELDRLHDKYVLSSDTDIVIDPFGTVFLSQHIEGQLNTRELLNSMHIKDGQLKLATILIHIIKNKIGDADIAKYLTSIGNEYYDPFSNTPMRWDKQSRTIFFPDPKSRCRHYSLKVPPSIPSSGSGNLGSNVKANDC